MKEEEFQVLAGAVGKLTLRQRVILAERLREAERPPTTNNMGESPVQVAVADEIALHLETSVQKKQGTLGFALKHWPALLLFVLGFLGYGLRAVDYFAAVPGDLGDASFNSVILEHLFHWLTRSGVQLWSPTFFYPFEGVLAFSDNHFGSALPYVLFRSLGAGREVAFDAWYLTGMALNFVCAYLVIRRLGLGGFAAAAGAFAFAFALPVLVREMHAQLTYRFAIPLAYSAFIEVFSTKRLYPLWRTVAWIAVQFFCSIYLGLFLIYLLVFCFCIISYWNRAGGLFLDLRNSIMRESARSNVFFVSIITISISTIIWLFYNYYSIAAAYGNKRPWIEVASMLPRLSSYLIADNSALTSWVGHFIAGIPMRHEHNLFFGVGIWLLALYGIAAWSSKLFQDRGKLPFFSLLAMFLFTLSLGGISVYQLVSYLPGLAAVRAVARIVLVMMLPISILVAIGSQRLLNQAHGLGGASAIALQSVVLVLLGAEVVAYKPYNSSIASWQAHETVFKEKIPSQLPADTILYVTGRSSDRSSVTETVGMMLAQDLGLPTLNGYSGNVPPGYLEPRPCISYRNRINSYAAYRGISLAAADALAARVKVIPLEICNNDPAIAVGGAVPASQAKKIDLKLDDVRVDNQLLKANLIIQNDSDEIFNTLRIGGPLRASWRFLKETTSDQDSKPGWEPRKDLEGTIAPGGKATIALTVPLPQASGKYIFQVSLVQDGVAWFHDLGMIVPSVKVQF